MALKYFPEKDWHQLMMTHLNLKDIFCTKNWKLFHLIWHRSVPNWISFYNWVLLGHTRSPGHRRLTYLLTISCLPKCKFLSVLCPSASLPPSPANNAVAVSHGSRTRWTLLRTGLLLLRSSAAETAAQLDARNTDTDAAHFFHLRHFLFYIIVYSLQIKHQVCT